MKLKAIHKSETNHNTISIVCDPPMTMELANLGNKRVSDRSELSFLERNGRLVVSGFSYPPTTELFDDMSELFKDLADNLAAEAQREREAHSKVVDTIAAAAKLPIEG